MRFDIVTLFPDLVEQVLSTSIIGRAREQGAFTAIIHNLREYGIGSYKQVDDTPYGGGPGMLIRVDVAAACLRAIDEACAHIPQEKRATVLTHAAGTVFTQETAEQFSRCYDQVTILCGHYEGFDARISRFVTHHLSLGQFVLTGGELPALVITDAIVRLLPGVLTAGSAEDESWSETSDGTRKPEYPHFTRPAEFEGAAVPEVLTQGNHAAIAAWREANRAKPQG
jgi:tRNA (guanine37-N1)-methyltransferase